jgi:hypothetical protein
MALTVHFEVLNQLGTPMMHSATLANRPAAGIAGRIFFRTDSPFGIFRDTGSAWDQISGASTFSGSLAAGQVAYGSATDTIAGNNNLFWDAAGNNLGIGTAIPTGKLDIVSDGGGQMIFSRYGGQPQINIRRSQGTFAAPVAVTSGASSLLNFQNYNGTAFASSAQIQVVPVAQTPTDAGATMALNVVRAGTTTMTNGLLVSGTNATPGSISITTGFNGPNTRLTIWGSTLVPTLDYFDIVNSGGGQLLRFFNTGNLVVGSSPDNGNRLQVTGGIYVSTVGEVVDVFTCGRTRTTLVEAKINQSITIQAPWAANNTVNLLSWFGSDTTVAIGLTGNNGRTVGSHTLLSISENFNPTSGNSSFQNILISSTINQTGGANGITRGLYANPTLTSAADWRSIEWSNNTGFGLYGAGTALNYLGGSLGIKTTAIYSPSTFSLDVNGGLLIKNTAGTTAQLTLINADPSLGGNNGFLVNTVGGTSGSSYVDLQGYYGTSITGSTALRLNPAGGPVIVNSTTNSGEQVQITGSLRVNGQLSPTMGTPSGQHLIINCDGTLYKINLFNP